MAGPPLSRFSTAQSLDTECGVSFLTLTAVRGKHSGMSGETAATTNTGAQADAAVTAGPIETVFSEREAELAVTSRIEAADGVVALTLADPEGAELPVWTPGAHIDLVLDDGLTRQYSLCGSPDDRTS